MMSQAAIRVLQVADNSIYAGLERQVCSLIDSMQGFDDLEPFLAVFNDGPLVSDVRALGVPAEVVPLSWRFDITAVRRLAALIRKWDIGLVHSHGYKANVIGAFAARWAGIRAIVFTEHGHIEPFQGFAKKKLEVYEALNRWAGNKLAGKVIAVSEDLRAHISPLYPLTDVVTVHNGIRPLAPRDLQVLSLRRESIGVNASTPLIGIVGRLKPVKGISDFLKSASLIHAKRPDARFVVVGDGPLLESSRLEAEALGLGEVIHFLGFCLDAVDWIAALDILVFSSLSEGIPYTLLEAMSLGVPAVATAVGGLPEIIEDETTGLLVPPQNPEALARACLELLEDPHRRHRMAQAGRIRCERHFSEGQMADETRQTYYEVLKATSSQRQAPEPIAATKVPTGARR